MELQTHGKLWAILHLRCPRCHHGRVYRDIFRMNKSCPVCRLVFEREPGYFTGALAFCYVFCTMLVVVWVIVLSQLFPEWSDILLHGLSLAVMLPFIPYVMRYARVIWMTMDR